MKHPRVDRRIVGRILLILIPAYLALLTDSCGEKQPVAPTEKRSVVSSVSYWGLGPTQVMVGESTTVGIKVKNTGNDTIHSLWLGMSIRDPNGNTVEQTRTSMNPSAGLDFGWQGLALAPTDTQTFIAPYRFSISSMGHAYGGGLYSWAYSAWENGPPGGGGSQIGELQTQSLNVQASPTNNPPSNPIVNISPSSPQESDFQNQYSTLKLRATASATDPDGDPVTFAYQWFRNEDEILGATGNELSATMMGRQGHTVRGYEFKVKVTASDNHGNRSEGEAAVTIGGPTFGAEMRACRFTNFWREAALNGAANPSIAVMKQHMGCNWVSIDMAYYQDNIDATTIYEKVSTVRGELSTIAESDLEGQIQYAHSLGLKVMLYPEICIGSFPGPRDQIPGSPEWFQAYQAKIVHLAEIAQKDHVEIFCIGVELRKTEDKAQSWRQLIQAVRAAFSGPIVYSAMYYPGVVDAISWWDAVDYIGVTCLFEIPEGGTDMTVKDLVGNYTIVHKYRDVIQQTSSKFNKPVIVTETCAYSLDGATKWGMGVVGHSTMPDLQEQADYFEAIFETFADQPWVVGLVVEDWIPRHEDWYKVDPGWLTGTALIGKPAEKVIRSWFTSIKTGIW